MNPRSFIFFFTSRAEEMAARMARGWPALASESQQQRGGSNWAQLRPCLANGMAIYSPWPSWLWHRSPWWRRLWWLLWQRGAVAANGANGVGTAAQTRESKRIASLSRGTSEAREQRWWELELPTSMTAATARAQSKEGASRGEGERVRERGSSSVHFWRA